MDSQYIDLTLDEIRFNKIINIPEHVYEMNVRRVGDYLVCLMRSKNPENQKIS